MAKIETESDDLKLIQNAVRQLPPQAIKDLLSNGVCERCILRLFGLHDLICSRPSLATQTLSSILYELLEGEVDRTNSDVEETKDSSDSTSLLESKKLTICGVCLGILQFVYNVENSVNVKKDSANEFSDAIRDVIKQEGYQIDSFALEISIPTTILENEQAVWTYVKKKFSSESWFAEKFPSETIPIKDFLKLSVTNPLQTLLDAKSNGSTFRIRLTYTFADTLANNQPMKENSGGYKRRKTDDNNDYRKIEANGNSSIEQKDDELGFLKFHQEKVDKCCLLTFQCSRTSIYIGGRYLKYSRNVSQSRWIIDDERMGEASVEELVGGNILPMCKGDSYKFHAAGREDIDVRMLGTGRPFLVEVINARLYPFDVLVKDMETKINSLENKLVSVKNLKVLGTQGWDLMREGEAEKQKQYVALVWISRPLDDDDVMALLFPKDMQIVQKTPIRVLHRRSPLEREKTIHWMRVEKIAGSSQYFLLHLCTQAGTYIKEFVHGDLGRTHPSIGSILKCRAEILQLDVTDVKMDCFM